MHSVDAGLVHPAVVVVPPSIPIVDRAPFPVGLPTRAWCCWRVGVVMSPAWFPVRWLGAASPFFSCTSLLAVSLSGLWFGRGSVLRFSGVVRSVIPVCSRRARSATPWTRNPARLSADRGSLSPQATTVVRRSILGARFKNAKTESDAESACYRRAWPAIPLQLSQLQGNQSVIDFGRSRSRFSAATTVLQLSRDNCRGGPVSGETTPISGETTVEVVPFPGRQLPFPGRGGPVPGSAPVDFGGEIQKCQN